VGQQTRLDVYTIVLYRQDDGSWVAEVPAIAGCYALMPTREEALAELAGVFGMIAEEFLERGVSLPEDTTEIVNASRHCAGLPACGAPARLCPAAPDGKSRAGASP
jgi:predicted RNase H-like HicB family nuclease